MNLNLNFRQVKMTNRRGSLKKRISAIKSKAPQIFNCKFDGCIKAYASEEALRLHVQVHSMESDLPYQLPQVRIRTLYTYFIFYILLALLYLVFCLWLFYASILKKVYFALKKFSLVTCRYNNSTSLASIFQKFAKNVALLSAKKNLWRNTWLHSTNVFSFIPNHVSPLPIFNPDFFCRWGP